MQTDVVGRDRELALARTVLAGLSDGPRALVIEGDAGIGKTAVWRAALAGGDGRVLACVADQAETRLAFAGLSDLIGDVAGDVLSELPPPQREALEVALARRARDPARSPDATAVSIAVRSLFVALARAGPVVVAVDDVQWLDAATARALAFTARRLGAHPVGMLVTVRAPLTAPDPLGIQRALGERARRLRLGPLDIAALRALIEARTGTAYARPALLRIARASGGNPLFALEIARALGPSPTLAPGAPLPVPDSVRELVQARVAALSADARQALLAVAALAQPNAGLVEAAASRAGLDACEDAGLVRVDKGRVGFAHPLYGAAVYEAAPTSRRRGLHRALAGLVEAPEERARHLALAAAGPDEAIAQALETAAATARGRGAWETAAELLERASALTPGSAEGRARERAIRAAEHHVHAGDRPRARALLEPLIDEQLQPSARADALRLLAELRYNEESFADAARLLEGAIEHARDPAVAIRIELSASYVHCHHLGDLERAERHAARALELAGRHNDDALLGSALAVRAMLDFMLGRDAQPSRIERALALEDPARPLTLELQPGMIAALISVCCGRLDDARERLTALRAACAERGDESDLALVLFWLAWLQTLEGDFAAAVATAGEALEYAALTGSQAARAWALAQRALAHAHRGDANATRADAVESAEIATRLRYLLPMLWSTTALTVLELSLGNAAAAWAAARPLAEAIEQRGIGEPLTGYFLPAATEALVALGNHGRAERLLDLFEESARRVDRPWALASAARARAVLAAGRGDLATANEQIARALAESERSGLPFELARTLLTEGGIARRRRRRRQARESLQRALTVFERIGAQRWTERTREELERVGSVRAPGELTPAEQRVIELAAAGSSNKEIAGSLFVTVHTVEVHLSRAYAKLGVHSRRQLPRSPSAP